MVTIRQVTIQDIDSLVSLFSSRSEYVDPFSQKAAILDPEHGLRSFKVALIAESAEGIAGFVAGQDSTLFPDSGIAQGTKLFVHPDCSRRGIAIELNSALDESLRNAEYEVRLDMATTRTPYSQQLLQRQGALPVGFLPDSLPPGYIGGQAGRESLVPMITYLTDEAKEQALFKRTSFALPYGSVDIADAVVHLIQRDYPSAFRFISTQAPSSRVSDRGENFICDYVQPDVLAQPMLPLDVLPLSRAETYSRIKSLLQSGMVPVAVVPLPEDDYLVLQLGKPLIESVTGAPFTSSAWDARISDGIRSVKETVLKQYLQPSGNASIGLQ